MLTNTELAKNGGFHLDQIQNEVYYQLRTYMTDNGLNQKDLADKLGFSTGYISQILNGNFNYSIKKLIDLSLAIDKVPIFTFADVDVKIQELDKLNSIKTIDFASFSNTQINNNKHFESDQYKYA